MSRLGAIAAMLYYFFGALGPAIRFGREIGESFSHALAFGIFGTPLAHAGFIGLGVLLVTVAGLQLFVTIGAVAGGFVGSVFAQSTATAPHDDGEGS